MLVYMDLLECESNHINLHFFLTSAQTENSRTRRRKNYVCREERNLKTGSNQSTSLAFNEAGRPLKNYKSIKINPARSPFSNF